MERGYPLSPWEFLELPDNNMKNHVGNKLREVCSPWSDDDDDDDDDDEDMTFDW